MSKESKAMERTLADAQEEAREEYELLARNGNPENRTVYIMEGCDCLDKGGKTTLYHVHVFTEQQHHGWRILQQDAGPIAAYKPRSRTGNVEQPSAPP
jgi:hypothetical protein